MSTVAPHPPAPPAPSRQTPEHRQFIDEQIERTRRSLQWTDVAVGAIGWASTLLAFLLAAAVLDHWVFRGGLSGPLRFGLFATLVGGFLWYGWRTLAPLVRPINPAYAAQAIERHSPSLKNSLLNLLLFRNGRQRLSAKVYDAIEQQTAERLALSDVDDAVDKSAALRKGYVLVGIAAICALYAVLSPKNMATSASRVLLPWANIAAPSRVQITDVAPGDGESALGTTAVIAATIVGAKPDESAVLYYRPLGDDGATGTPQSLPLRAVGAAAADGGQRVECQVPAPGGRGSTLGLQEPIEYWIEAGDARSRRYRLDLFLRPTIVVQHVRYEPPSYTGLPTSETQSTGDVEGLEGTRVTISAQANRPIKAAHIDFGADGTRDLAMQLDGDRAVGTFTLALGDDRRTARHESYVLRFADNQGRTNEDPAKYRIAATADYPPEVRLTAPAEPEVAVGVDQRVAIGVDARDPDFALAAVRVAGEVDGRRIDLGTLLEGSREGRFQGTLPFVPSSARLQPGQVLEYWAVAEDNRRPQANVATSERQRLRIVAPDQPGGQGQNQQQDGGENAGGENRGGAPGDEEGEGSAEGGPGGQGDKQGTSPEGGAGQSSPQQPGENQSSESGEGDNGEDQSGAPQAGAGDDQSQQQEGESGEGESGAGMPGGTGEGQESSDQSDAGAAGGQSQEPSGDQPSADGSAGGNQPGQDGRQGDNAPGAGQSTGERQDGSHGDAPRQPGDARSQPGEGESSAEPVSPTGDDDGSAFDRLAEHFGTKNEQHQDQPGGSGSQQSGANDQSQPSDQNRNGEQGDADERSAAGSPSDREEGQAAPDERPDGAQGQQDHSPRGGNQGEQFAEENAGAPEGQEGDTPSEQGEQGEDPNGVNNPNQGPGGGGSKSDGQQAPPDAGQQPQERDKTDRDPAGAEAQSDEAPSGGQSKKESDSTGGQSGDQSGGGSEGAGQRADSDGQGAPGENMAADEGAGAAEEGGPGETGADAGDQQPAAGKTGNSSDDQPGPGSKAGQTDQPGESTPAADDPSAESGEAPPQGAQPGGSQPSAGKPSDPSAGRQPPPGEAPKAPGGAPPRGGTGSGGDMAPPESEETVPDEANLDYARQQTELILNRLEDQLAKQQVDQELLKKLGWSQADLRRFVDRWKSLRDRAAGAGPNGQAAQAELDEALRSLGLRRTGPQRFDAAAAEDERRADDAYRARAPREYQDRVRAYIRGAAAGGDGEK
ncbi:MAG: hypothetical protein KF688_13995 [Pirellulales bacterium]|nr:hypothetical protein [Pirellulales bacterium]